MKHLPLLVIAVVLACAACGKAAPKAAVAVADVQAGSALKQDDDLAAKLAAAYPTIRCALAANQHAVASLYTDAGFADGPAFFRAFDVQAKANPIWARKVTSEALAKPCVEPPAAATPAAAPAAPSTGNTP